MNILANLASAALLVSGTSLHAEIKNVTVKPNETAVLHTQFDIIDETCKTQEATYFLRKKSQFGSVRQKWASTKYEVAKRITLDDRKQVTYDCVGKTIKATKLTYKADKKEGAELVTIYRRYSGEPHTYGLTTKELQFRINVVDTAN